MKLKIIKYNGEELLIDCKSFEFRTNQVANWIRLKYDDHTEMIKGICVIKCEEVEDINRNIQMYVRDAFNEKLVKTNMYESPIEKIYGEIQTQIIQEDENAVMQAVRNVDINVNKEELIKALQYDRKQYAKGYADGKNEVLGKIRAEIQENINYNKKMNYQGIVAGLLLTCDIIDKYKEESEE